MEHIDYFKLQAKNLLKDFKTRFFNQEEKVWQYNPKFFDIENIFFDYEIPDDKPDFNFTLMNAQHLIAKMAGFSKWNDLVNANPVELELSHLLYDNAHKVSVEEWNEYIMQAEYMNNVRFNAEEKLEIFKQVFSNVDKHRSDFPSYRIDLAKKQITSPVDITENAFNSEVDLYDELDEKEKLAAIKAHQNSGCDYNIEETVECLHCGARYKFVNVKAIRVKPQYRTLEDFDRIVCKNYPKCSGKIIDLMKVGVADKNKGTK